MSTIANQEHLDMLKQGAKVWNQWRGEGDNRLVRPDLSEVDLSGFNIRRSRFVLG